ncbi:dynein heavy chain [Corchorus olitorius]|uniref:Dynein heavy chain n=1 Tax=Corchorus olitorius TaxID=93759 RepID=A0A1R3G8U9_9ROSI|nr:dynein heavy chain [Corchorus olitorius]
MTEGLTWQGTNLATEYFAVSSRILSLSFAPFLLNFGRKSSSSCLDDSKGLSSRVRVQVNDHFEYVAQMKGHFHCRKFLFLTINVLLSWKFKIQDLFANPFAIGLQELRDN